MLKQMYADIGDATYQGDPTETLQLVEEKWEEYRQLREMPDYLDLVGEEPVFNFDPFDATPQETTSDEDADSLGAIETKNVVVSKFNHLVSSNSFMTVSAGCQRETAERVSLPDYGAD